MSMPSNLTVSASSDSSTVVIGPCDNGLDGPRFDFWRAGSWLSLASFGLILILIILFVDSRLRLSSRLNRLTLYCLLVCATSSLGVFVQTQVFMWTYSFRGWNLMWWAIGDLTCPLVVNVNVIVGIARIMSMTRDGLLLASMGKTLFCLKALNVVTWIVVIAVTILNFIGGFSFTLDQVQETWLPWYILAHVAGGCLVEVVSTTGTLYLLWVLWKLLALAECRETEKGHASRHRLFTLLTVNCVFTLIVYKPVLGWEFYRYNHSTFDNMAIQIGLQGLTYALGNFVSALCTFMMVRKDAALVISESPSNYYQQQRPQHMESGLTPAMNGNGSFHVVNKYVTTTSPANTNVQIVQMRDRQKPNAKVVPVDVDHAINVEDE